MDTTVDYQPLVVNIELVVSLGIDRYLEGFLKTFECLSSSARRMEIWALSRASCVAQRRLAFLEFLSSAGDAKNSFNNLPQCLM